MRGEKWRHLPHVSHAADVPVADVLVKRRRPKEHSTVRRHAQHGMRTRNEEGKEGGRKGGGKDTPSGHNTRLCCAVALALASASCADGISAMAGPYGCGAGVAHSGACSHSDSGHLTSEDHDGGQKTATMYGEKRGTGGGDGARV